MQHQLHPSVAQAHVFAVDKYMETNMQRKVFSAVVGVWQHWKIRHIGSLIPKLNTLCFDKETNPGSGKHTVKFLKPESPLNFDKMCINAL